MNTNTPVFTGIMKNTGGLFIVDHQVAQCIFVRGIRLTCLFAIAEQSGKPANKTI
jgi:hypothetical protein